MTTQILKRRSRREGGQILQELKSIREGKYRDDAKGGWLDPVLVRKAREEEMQYVKKHAVYEKVPMSQCWKETREPHQNRLGGHEQGNVRVSEHKIFVGHEGIQHWIQARLVQCSVASGRSEARHLGSRNQKVTALLVIYVRRVYFNAKARCVWAAEKELVWHPGHCLKLGMRAWRRLACARDKRAHAYPPKRRGESALRSMVMMSLSRP